MLFIQKPTYFNSEMEAVGCFIENSGQILVLKRASHKIQPERWGLPGGKVESGESLEDAMVREVLEETGFLIQKEDLVYVIPVYVENDGRRLTYHIFKLQIPEKPSVNISPAEHMDHDWVEPDQFMTWNGLMEDMVPCVKLAYNL